MAASDSDEDDDEVIRPLGFALEACDAASRSDGFRAGYGHGYHNSSRPTYDRDEDDRYEGYEAGYQAGCDTAHRDECDQDGYGSWPEYDQDGYEMP